MSSNYESLIFIYLFIHFPFLLVYFLLQFIVNFCVMHFDKRKMVERFI